MKILIKLTFISLLVLTFLVGNASSIATVEVTTGKLPDQFQEGKQVDFTIKIKNYEGTKQLTLETNLVPSMADKPLWNFGESESIINANRYQQKITLDLSSLPAVLSVVVSGKVPDGVDRIKCDDIVLNKMHETKLKFYEVRADDKLAGIESFELILSVKEDFEKTLQQIRRKEFDGMKVDVENVFNSGLTTEAQKLATEMNNVKWPGSLKLFGIITIESDLMINAVIIVLIIVCLIIGYLLGSRESDEE